MASNPAARAGDSAGGRGTLVLLTIALVTFFFMVVTYGWMHLLLPLTGEPIVAVSFALLLTLIALLFARYLGDKQAQKISQGEGGTRLIDWAIFIPFLLLISAMGTTNSAFYKFQGGAVLQEDIDNAQNKLRELEGAAGSALGDAEFQARQQRLVALLASLRHEVVSINGGNFCGVGSNALGIIRDIQVILPGFRIPNGTIGRTRCDQIDEQAIYDGLEDQANELLEASSDPLLARLKRQFVTAQQRLKAAEERLNATGEFDDSRYQVAQAALQDAANQYADARTELVERLPAAAQGRLPKETALDISQSTHLGSIASLVPTLLSRLDEGSTWVYVVTGIALDLALVYFFTQIALAARNFRPRVIAPVITDPRFLWVNPPELPAMEPTHG